MRLWEKICRWAEITPRQTALAPLTYAELRRAVLQCLSSLPDVNGQRVGLFITNRPLWGIYDIALTLGGATVVPIPAFFSAGQVRHLITDANLDAAVVEPELAALCGFTGLLDGLFSIEVDPGLEHPRMSAHKDRDFIPSFAPDGISKIIYTSGTTGAPKGVRITATGIAAVTLSLITRTGVQATDRHLSVLPLSTLVETIGGLYLPLMAGATVLYPPMVSQGAVIPCDLASLGAIIAARNITTLNLVPAILDPLLRQVERNPRIIRSLRFAACGGAMLDSRLIARAYDVGLPLYHGYGLSECGSVVSLNSIGDNRPKSVGRPLPHATVTIADDGEVLVSGPSLMAGYLRRDRPDNCVWPTGDVGCFDDDGFLYITGRKDRTFSTGEGRNLSARWVESTISRSPAVHRVSVENRQGRPHARIVPDPVWLVRQAGRDKTGGSIESLLRDPPIIKAMEEEIEAASSLLPLYARVARLTLCDIATFDSETMTKKEQYNEQF